MRGRLRLVPHYSAADVDWAEDLISSALEQVDEAKVFYDYDDWEKPDFICPLLKKVAANNFGKELITRVSKTSRSIELQFKELGATPEESPLEIAPSPEPDAPAEPLSAPLQFSMPGEAPDADGSAKSKAVKVTKLAPDPKLKSEEEERPKSKLTANQRRVVEALRAAGRPLSKDELLEQAGIARLPRVLKGVRTITFRKKDQTEAVRYELDQT